MPLTLTASYIESQEAPWASKLSTLIDAVDEVMSARFGYCSPLIFPQANPQLELGEQFVFGNLSNISSPFPPYSADEFPSPPAFVNIDEVNPITKYVTVSGVSDFGVPTLNRKSYTFTPTGYPNDKYWAKYDKPERFLKLGVADIIVEDYTNPFTSVKTNFYLRAHWDKYGCVRIHNGNRFELTVSDNSGSSVVVPAYGIKCGRRLTPDAPFTWSNNYLHKTYPNDELSYDAEHAGQYAGCINNLTTLISNFSNFCKFNAIPDSNSTSRETASFSGTNPVSTDYFQDWINHRGKVLSVRTHKITGATFINELTWNGVNSGFSPSGHVNLSWGFGYYSFDLSSTVLDTNYYHHLIPKSTNILGTSIIDLTDGAVHTVYTPNIARWTHLQSPLPHGNVTGSVQSLNKPYFDSNKANSSTIILYQQLPGNTNANGYATTLDTSFPSYTSAVSKYKFFTKTSDAIGCEMLYDLSEPLFSCVSFDAFCLDNASYDPTGSLTLTTAEHFGRTNSRLRFTARQNRKYHILSDPDYHPQDSQIAGTTDGLAGDIQLNLQPIYTSSIQIEGADYNKVRPAGVGTFINWPADNLHYVLSNIYTPLWWFNYLTNPTSWEKQITWRIPRLIEQFNDLASCVNSIREVNQVTLEQLYKDPLPSGCRSKPWQVYGEPATCVPYDWIAGRVDTSNTLANWCSTWGITPNTVDISTLTLTERTLWKNLYSWKVYDVLPQRFTYGYEKVNWIDYDSAGNNIEEVKNGQIFQRRKAIYSSKRNEILFNSSGDLSNYRYITTTQIATAFSFIIARFVQWVADEVGYRYNPQIEESVSLTKLNGTYYGDIDYADPDFVGLVNTCQILYKLPDIAGDWFELVNDKEHFRLGDKAGGSDTVISELQDNPNIPGNQPEWLVHSLNYSTDGKRYSYEKGSTGDVTAKNSNGLIPHLSGKPAWRNIPSLTCNYPIILIVSSEESYSHEYSNSWNDNPLTWDVWSTHTVNLIPLLIKHVDPSEYPITADTINSWTGLNRDYYHVQVIKQTGIIRQ